MGQYIDFSNTRRDTFTFRYSAEELLPFVAKKYEDLTKEENNLRNSLERLVADHATPASSDEFSKLQRKITNAGTYREQTFVFMKELERRPEEYYLLGYGDITYFDLVMMPPAEQMRD